MLDRLMGLFSTAPSTAACDCGYCDGSKEHLGRASAKLNAIFFLRLILSALLLVMGLVFLEGVTAAVLLVLTVLIAGYDVMVSGVLALVRGKKLVADFLILLGALAACLAGLWGEAAAIMVLYQLWNAVLEMLMQLYRSKSVDGLLRNEGKVCRISGENHEELVDAGSLEPGDVIRIPKGGTVPVDCGVLDVHGAISLRSLTGASESVKAEQDDMIPAGAVNMGTDLLAEVLRPLDRSAAAVRAKTVLSAPEVKSKTEHFLEKFSGIFVLAAILIGIVAAVLFSVTGEGGIADGIRKGLVVLAVGCPCGWLLSASLSMLVGVGNGARKGILFTGTAAVETLAQAKVAGFDSAGTLTAGKYRVVSVRSEKMPADMFLQIAAHSEAYSQHDIAKTIVEAYGGKIYIELIESFREYAGQGVSVSIDGKKILLGSAAFLAGEGVSVEDDHEGTAVAVYMALEGLYAGRLILVDPIKEEAAAAVRKLENLGVETMLFAVGESAGCEQVAEAVGLRDCCSAADPEELAGRIRARRSRLKKGRSLICIGTDTRKQFPKNTADASISLGSVFTLAERAKADVVIAGEDLDRVSDAVILARKVKTVQLTGLILVAAAKAAALVLGLFGLLPLWAVLLIDRAAAAGALVCASGANR